jgi:putative membrane protein
VKPVVKVLGCAFYVLTLGLIAFVVNALLFLMVGLLAGAFGLGFTVDGFGPAFVGAIIVGLVSFLLHLAIPDRLDQR